MNRCQLVEYQATKVIDRLFSVGEYPRYYNNDFVYRSMPNEENRVDNRVELTHEIDIDLLNHRVEQHHE